MFSQDTLDPRRILKTLKRFLNNRNAKFPFNNRGEVDPPVDPLVDPPVEPPTNWRDSLPDLIKTDPLFQKYDSPNDAHTALLNAQKFLGRESLPVPSGPEDTDAYNMIFSKLGRPDNVDGYISPEDLKFEEGFPALDEGLVKSIKQSALDSGMLPQQYDKMYRSFMGYANNQFKAAKEKVVADRQAAETGLRGELGAAYPQAEALAQKVVLKFADQAAWDKLDGGLGNNPAMIKMLYNIGKTLSEHNLVGAAPSASYSPDEAQSEINKMKGDLKGPLYDKTHAQHQEFVDKVSMLTEVTLAK